MNVFILRLLCLLAPFQSAQPATTIAEDGPFAWSAGAGWIQFSTGQLRTATIFDADGDTDGTSDA